MDFNEGVSIAEARNHLSDVVGAAKHGRRCVTLLSRGTAVAVLVPADLGAVIEAAGGPDAALAILRGAAAVAVPDVQAPMPQGAAGAKRKTRAPAPKTPPGRPAFKAPVSGGRA